MLGEGEDHLVLLCDVQLKLRVDVESVCKGFVNIILVIMQIPIIL